MTRTLSLLTNGLVAILVLATFASRAAAASEKRPNILFLFADDWGRYASAYAEIETRPSPSQAFRTPN
ncbi:MAG: hypothetical protein KDA42_09875, partial [Planctomycetales bacterium]|nr:hypothetical protein [Planctomycetales bacterium]